jgi:hypothetical protein
VSDAASGRWVEVQFDCLPLRSVVGMQIPDDASPKLAAKLERVRQALEKHGSHNSYYLHNALCRYHLTNDPQLGMVEFSFEGTILTSRDDMEAQRADIHACLNRETCSWLTQSIVDWLAETVHYSLLVEFNRYIRNGDLSKTIERLNQLEKQNEDAGGFVGMWL